MHTAVAGKPRTAAAVTTVTAAHLFASKMKKNGYSSRNISQQDEHDNDDTEDEIEDISADDDQHLQQVFFKWVFQYG